VDRAGRVLPHRAVRGVGRLVRQPNIGSGASFTGNSLTADVTEGIAVSGMLNATATGNTLKVTLGQHGSCPRAEIAMDPQLGSGTIQPPVTSADVRGCIG
jgi:hypothetical protein